MITVHYTTLQSENTADGILVIFSNINKTDGAEACYLIWKISII